MDFSKTLLEVGTQRTFKRNMFSALVSRQRLSSVDYYTFMTQPYIGHFSTQNRIFGVEKLEIDICF